MRYTKTDTPAAIPKIKCTTCASGAAAPYKVPMIRTIIILIVARADLLE
jgi:hypothetical protein